MNTRNFKCFQAVYEEKNLQLAASKLFISPQGLSKIIKSLEEECGTRLFTRSKEGLIPTETGKIFYEKSKILIRELNDMFATFESMSDKEKRFKIGFAAGTVRAVDILKINDFMKNNPEILAIWHEYENKKIIKQLLDDEISFGLVVGEVKEKDLIAELVKSYPIVAYVYKGHRFWDKEFIEIEDLKDEALISMNENYHIYNDLIDACNLKGFNPKIAAKLAEGESIYRLVSNKVGIGISPEFLERDKEIKAIKIKEAPNWNIYAAYKQDSANKEIAKSFLKKLTR